MKHVDDFIRNPPADEAGRYAAFCFMLFRLPPATQQAFRKWTDQYKLFCTHKGKRYRVTGASRSGLICLANHFDRLSGYDIKADLGQCSRWADFGGERRMAPTQASQRRRKVDKRS